MTEGGTVTFTVAVTNNDATADVAVEDDADLSITKTSDMDTVTEGDTVTFTIQVTNNDDVSGDGDTAMDVTVTDTFTDNATFVSADGDGGYDL